MRHSDQELGLIFRALAFAAHKHKDQRRKDAVQVKRYPKMCEVIHDGSKPPKMGSYTPPMPYFSEKPKLINKIISVGQTGADRAALDFAIAHNIPHGGWCPKGRKAEDSVISSRYRL